MKTIVSRQKRIWQSISSAREDLEKRIEEQAARIAELQSCLRNMKKVTRLLGQGVGKIAIDADFIGLWNDTEIEASRLLAIPAKMTK